ncbi:MAG: hypothetical protein ACT4PZ_05660 [Panacagrimonas sp.]
MQTPPLSTAAGYPGVAYAEAAYVEPTTKTASSAVSWAAILVGAFAAAALSLILLVLGSGLGFSSVSPWANDGASAKAIGIATVIWIILMAAIASGMGGYLSGRLRTRWADVHSDEVFFRDTAHGFLTWAIATLLTAALLSSAVGSLIGGAAKAGGAAAGAMAGSATALGDAAESSSPDGYFVDMLFRKGPQSTAVAEAPGASPVMDSAEADNAGAAGAAGPGSAGGLRGGAAEEASPAAGLAPAPRPMRAESPSTDTDDASARAEVGRIFVVALREGGLAPADETYLAQLVARHAAIGQAEAEQRVAQVIEDAKAAAAEIEQTAREAADEARKAGAKLSLWLFVSLLVGAFCGSYAATIGGRQRDRDGAIPAVRQSRPLAR